MNTKIALALVAQALLVANLVGGQQLSEAPLSLTDTISGTDDAFNTAITGFSDQLGKTLSQTLGNLPIPVGRQANMVNNMMGMSGAGNQLDMVNQMVSGLASDEREMLRREMGVVISVLNMVNDRISATNSIEQLTNRNNLMGFGQEAPSLGMDSARQLAQPVGSMFTRVMGRHVGEGAGFMGMGRY